MFSISSVVVVVAAAAFLVCVKGETSRSLLAAVKCLVVELGLAAVPDFMIIRSTGKERQISRLICYSPWSICFFKPVSLSRCQRY